MSETALVPARSERAQLYAAVAAVMAELPPVPKDDRNREQGYSYTSEHAIANAIRPLLAQHGLCIIPTAHAVAISTYPTKSGGTMFAADVEAHYVLGHKSGAEIECVGTGRGADTSDKAVAKALTAAFKSMLIQLFVVGRSDTDADATTPEEATSAPQSVPRQSDDGDRVTVPFGSFKGRDIREVPDNELRRMWQWCVDKQKFLDWAAKCQRYLSAKIAANAAEQSKMPPGPPKETADEIPF